MTLIEKGDQKTYSRVASPESVPTHLKLKISKFTGLHEIPGKNIVLELILSMKTKFNPKNGMDVIIYFTVPTVCCQNLGWYTERKELP